jgi:hypothetical protein
MQVDQGAYYLAGYAVECSFECSLKACIAKRIREFDFPDKKLANESYTHNLGSLIVIAGLQQELRELESRNEEFSINWSR